MWIRFKRRKPGIYIELEYGKGKYFALGKLPYDAPSTGLLDLVLAATKRTRSIAILTALRDADKHMRG